MIFFRRGKKNEASNIGLRREDIQVIVIEPRADTYRRQVENFKCVRLSFPMTNHQYAHLKSLTTFFFCSPLKKGNKIHAIHKKIVPDYKKLRYIYMSYITDTKELVIFLVKF